VERWTDRAIDVARLQARILSLRFSRADLFRLETRHLVFGLAVTWLVGLGRYWDHLVILAVLGLVLWALILPLRPVHWSLAHLYAFLSLTALPGLLYAIPVERFMTLEAARTANVWFLAVVAAWRVLLLGLYLRRYGGLAIPMLAVALLLPVALIISALTFLNLEKAVFDLMSGLREDGTANDAAYAVLTALTLLSVAAAPILILSYAVAVYRGARARRLAIKGAT
jgi:hypothetical protein